MPGLLMRPEEGEVKAKKCEAKHFCEAEAKTYEAVTIRFHVSYNIVLGSDGYLYILSHFGCLPNASLDWPV